MICIWIMPFSKIIKIDYAKKYKKIEFCISFNEIN